MKILLLFLVANVFARPQPTPSAADWLSEIDKLISKYLSNEIPLYQQPQSSIYPPIEKDVTFWCVKPNQKDLKQVTVNDPDVASKLDLSKPINFVIHGWLGLNEQTNGEVMYKRDVLKWARFGDCNACSVDWNRLAKYNYSTTATKHTRMVSAAIVNFLKFLSQYGMNIEQVSIAGFSLGAQIAGFIGASFPQQKLAAIYGLDPAGPGFTVPLDYGVKNRLDPTDAKYVQCVFTNQFILGTGIDCGHSNFYMNGGICQPGCLINVNCSHQRAHAYFNESLNPKRKFIGERCENPTKQIYLELMGKRCSDVHDQLGPYTARKKGRFFVKTNSQFPYSLGK